MKLRSTIAALHAALLAILLAASPVLAGSMTLLGAGKAPAGGVTPASFTFGGSIGPTAGQVGPSYSNTGTFNTGASDLAIVAVVSEGDGTGAMSAVSVAGTPLTCVQGLNNSSGEQAWLCYGSVGAQTTATFVITHSGTANFNIVTGSVTTTTPTPYSTGNSTGAQGGGVSTPFAIAATTGSGGVPVNGVSVGIIGDFFSIGRTFTSMTPNQDAVFNYQASNGSDALVGHTTTSGSTSGLTANSTGSIFPAWAIVSWSP